MVAAGALWLAGCGGESASSHQTTAAADSPLALLGVARPESSDGCVYANDRDGATATYGLLDTLLTDRYVAMLRVENRGARDITMRGANVRLEDEAGDELGEYDVTTGGIVLAGSISVIRVTLIPDAAGVPDHVYAKIEVSGESVEGVARSLSLTYEIELCAGCLINFPPEADNTATPGFDCTRPSDAAIVEPCILGQDVNVDCRLCTATVASCMSPP